MKLITRFAYLCFATKQKTMTNLTILSKVGKLTIISEPYRKFPLPTSKKLRTFVDVNCECGITKSVQVFNLKYGYYSSCGCEKHRRAISGFRKTHGLNNHKLHRVWVKMRERCYYRKGVRYTDWGGRGIKVCDEWKSDFMTFYNWAKDKWEEGLQIDRINNDGNYEPSNCRFVTAKENSLNRRKRKPNNV